MHFLVVPGFEDGNKTTFEQISRVNHMLGGIGYKITGQIIDQGASFLGELGGRSDHIGGLEKAWDFHGDHAVSAS